MSNLFEKFLDREPLFINKKVMQSNYTPETIPHRETMIEQMAEILSPAIQLNKPSNLFIYGKTGSGKTLSVIHTTNKLSEITKKQNKPVVTLYINCKLKKIADTEYRLVAQLIRNLGGEVPVTGLPTEEIYKIFFNLIDQEEQLIILVLDEIDELVKKIGDDVLYNFTRINAELKKAQLTLIGISNDLIFADHLDHRVKSSLSEEELVFPPYNALQLQDILRDRAKQAFKENTIQPGVVEKCAAYAAREHGDARRALELLRVSGEIAEREGKQQVCIEHIDKAEEKIEKERIVDLVVSQPKQHQATLYALIMIHQQQKRRIFTGEAYDFYKQLTDQIGLRPLTQRRFSDIISELDMLGIINAKVLSKGRYGRTKEIELSLPQQVLLKICELLQRELHAA